MNSIKIGNEDFPIHFGHSAMVKMLGLAKMTKFTELDKLLTDFPLDKAPEAIIALIDNGIKVNKRNMKTPPKEAVIAALDENLMLWVDVLNAIGDQFKLPEEVTEGNSPTKTSAT